MRKLIEKINSDLKAAMKAKDAATLSVLRMLLAAARNKEITLRQGGAAELTDEQTQEIVAGEIKKRRDSREAYKRGKRPELAAKENAEIKILEKYLPARLSDDELAGIIKEVIAAGASDFGRVMGQVMARVKGKAYGTRAAELVKKLLER